MGRSAKASNYGSYCRCVKGEKISNNKKKGEETAKMAKSSGAVATKSLANKLARASYYMMRDQVPFDKDKLFC